MKCLDCIYHIQEWNGIKSTMTATGGMTFHYFCNNPECEYYNKEVIRMDACDAFDDGKRKKHGN